MDSILSRSALYERKRCFEKTCIFRSVEPVDGVIRKSGQTYVVNASKPLPVPYSRHFNVSTSRTENGFLKVKGSGRKVVGYRSFPWHLFGLVISFISVLFTLFLWKREEN